MENDDTENMCRLCLTRGKPMTSVFEFHNSVQYAYKIMHCARVQISELENLPSVICTQCQSDLLNAYDFVVKCQRSDEHLRKYYQMKQITIDKTEEVPIKFEHVSDETEFVDNRLEEDFSSNITVKDEFLRVENNVKPEEESPELDSKTEPTQTVRHPEISDVENEKLLSDKNRKRPSYSKSDTVCQTCGLQTNSMSALICHTRTHTGEKPFICPVCGISFAQKGTLHGHVKRKHLDKNKNNREFSCENCGKLFFTKRDLTIHFRIHTGETPYACQFCPKHFSQQGTLISHLRLHTGERPFSCDKCKKTFNKKSALTSHASVHSDEKLFTCNICGKSVKTKRSLIGHIEFKHSDCNQFICDQCGAVYKTKGCLKRHTVSVHSEKSGNCSVCSKDVPDLISHMRRHTGQDTVSCKICHKKFSYHKSLVIHMNSHADKFKCNEKSCKKIFPTKYLFDFHNMKYHSHEVPYHCKLCKKGCLRKCDLKRHMQFYHKSEA